MSSTNQNNGSSDEISLKEFFIKTQEWGVYLRSKWLIILAVIFVGGAVGVFYAKSNETKYVAQLTFVLDNDKGVSGASGFSGISSMLGLNMGGGDGIFQGENIFELYKSRTMLTQALLSSTPSNDSLLIDRYIQINGLKDKWKDNPSLSSLNFNIPSNLFTIKHDSLLNIFVEDINSDYLKVYKPDKSLSFLAVEITSSNEHFAKDLCEIIVDKVNTFYVQTKTKKATDNTHIIQMQADSVRNELNAAIGGVAANYDVNPNPNPTRRSLEVSSTKRQVDVQANQVILTELVKSLEMSKISLRRETPLIQVIDKPFLPLKKVKFSVIKGVALGGITFGFIIILILVISRVYKLTMEEH